MLLLIVAGARQLPARNQLRRRVVEVVHELAGRGRGAVQLGREPHGDRLRIWVGSLAEHRPGNSTRSALALQKLEHADAGQPRFIPEGRGDDVAVRLLVVGGALAAEVLAVLVHEMALVAVHGLEGVRAALLFALLGQLHELGEPVVHVLAELRVLLRPRSHVLGVAGRQLLAQVRVADLQPDRQSSVAVDYLALLVALQPATERQDSDALILCRVVRALY